MDATTSMSPLMHIYVRLCSHIAQRATFPSYILSRP